MRKYRRLIAGLLLCTPLVFGACAQQTAVPEVVLLITVDTLRADHVGFYSTSGSETPVLDALAQESIVFEQAFAPASFTVPSITTLLTGFYPEQNAIFSNEHVLPQSVPTLAAHLAQRGYKTGAVVSNFVLRSETGLGRAFDLYDDRLPQREIARGLPERTAEETTVDALAVLDLLLAKKDGPVFLWVHYQDPHGPYTPEDSERARFRAAELQKEEGQRVLALGSDHRGLGALPNYQVVAGQRQVAFYRAGYRAEIAATDHAIGKLLQGVKGRAPWDRTLAVFASDHGEAMGEDDYWFAHGEVLTEGLTRVPLMIRVPGHAAERRSDLAGLVDLVPTLLPLVGLAADSELPGRDLLALDAADQEHELYLSSLLGASLPRIGLVSQGHLYQATRGSDGEVSEVLFRLGADQEQVAQENPALLKTLRERVRILNAELRAKGEERLQSLSESDRSIMDGLGYGGNH